MPVEAEPDADLDAATTGRSAAAPVVAPARRPEATGSGRVVPTRRRRSRVAAPRAATSRAGSRAPSAARSERTPTRRRPRSIALIRDVPDFPKPGVHVQGHHPAARRPRGVQRGRRRARRGRSRRDGGGGGRQGGRAWRPAASSSAAPVALDLGRGFVPVRKAGKLPRRRGRCPTTSSTASETLEMHTDAIAPGDRVLVVDDVLATGGTAKATVQLVEAARRQWCTVSSCCWSWLPARPRDRRRRCRLTALRTV